MVGSKDILRNVFGLSSLHVLPSRELQTSFTHVRGKWTLSLLFQPPKSHIRPLNVSAPAPSRHGNPAFAVTSFHSYSTRFDSVIPNAARKRAVFSPSAATSS